MAVKISELASATSVTGDETVPLVQNGITKGVSLGNIVAIRRTDAEIAATVFPTDYRYPPGDIRRYGTNTTPGTTDMTAAFSNCLAANGFIDLQRESYSVTGLTLATGQAIRGKGMNDTTIVLAAAANDHVLFGEDVTDIVIRDLKIDGNKSNQSTGTGNNWRGLYLLGATRRIRLDNVFVTNVVDHGVFFSDDGDPTNEPGKDSTLTGVIATNCGSAAHISGGGAGGTGIAGGCNSTILLGCYATGNYLNGFKTWGRHIGCDAYSNTGGGFETGFNASGRTQTKYQSCRALSNGGDGWRNQSEVDELTWVACESKGNDHAGIMFLNAVDRASIIGCWIINNGQANADAARSDTVCYDGVAITATSTAGSHILISGSHFFDDQATETQEYHLYVRDTATNVVIEGDNTFGDCKEQVVYVEALAVSSSVTFRNAYGLPFVTKDFTTATLTGSTSATDLKTITIPAFSMCVGTSLKVRGRGTVSGTAGAKTIRLDVAGTTTVVSAQLAAEEFVWAFEATLHRSSSSLLTITFQGYEVGGNVVSGAFSVSISTSVDLTIAVEGELGDAGDTITQNLFEVSTTD